MWSSESAEILSQTLSLPTQPVIPMTGVAMLPQRQQNQCES